MWQTLWQVLQLFAQVLWFTKHTTQFKKGKIEIEFLEKIPSRAGDDEMNENLFLS